MLHYKYELATEEDEELKYALVWKLDNIYPTERAYVKKLVNIDWQDYEFSSNSPLSCTSEELTEVESKMTWFPHALTSSTMSSNSTDTSESASRQ